MSYAEAVRRMVKKAKDENIYRDWLFGIPGRVLPYGIGNAAALGGTLTGFVEGGSETSGHPALALVPGVSDYRIMRKQLANAKKHGSRSPRRRVLSELLGPLPATLLAAGVGALAGGTLGGAGGKPIEGAALGLSAGAALSGVGHLAGLLCAGITPTRTDEEQTAYETDTNGFENVAGNLLVPGVAFYNYYKRMGNIRMNEKRRQEAEDAKKDAQVGQ